MAAPPNPTHGNHHNQEPIREEQVQNGVKFLSHPKVKGSPVMYRRSFLERKGLTKKEVDEAFRRVPDETPSLSTTQADVANQGGQSQPISNIQAQVPTQYQQPVAAAHGSKLGMLTASRFHWPHALLAVGALAITGAGTAVVIKNAVVPRLKSWIHKVAHQDGEEDLAKKTNAKKINTKPTLVEEASASAAKTVASYVARASQEMVSKTEEKRNFGELKSLLGMQVQEMKAMSNSMKKLEENRHFEELTSLLGMQVEEMKSMSNSIKKLEERSLSPYPKSYQEIMAMVQRGEIVLDEPKPKPWEAAEYSQGNSTYPPENSNGLTSCGQDNGYRLSASVYQSDGDSSTPWWQRPAWVPPQPPPVAMAEAAAIIRQPSEKGQVANPNIFLNARTPFEVD